MAMTHEGEMYPSRTNGSGNMTQREEFGATETAIAAETASGAAAAQAQAAVQARYIMALRRPRDIDQVRVRLLKDCKRLRFAEVAKYRKPVGKKKNEDTGKWEQQFVEGPSIRFAEAALRALTNVYPEISTVYDDDRKRIVRVSVTDLESNLTYAKDVVIEKVVERSNAEGRILISQRLNSWGKTTYTVVATDDELAMKESALVSKAMRQHALRIMPGDLVEEAMDLVYDTVHKGVADDPDAHRKKLVDAFFGLGVQPAQLAEFLGHELGTANPGEIVKLREIYATIRDGETSWHEVMEGREKAQASEQETEAPAQPRTTADLAKRAKKKPADESPSEPGENG
jgi:hypothetical protein